MITEFDKIAHNIWLKTYNMTKFSYDYNKENMFFWPPNKICNISDAVNPHEGIRYQIMNWDGNPKKKNE